MLITNNITTRSYQQVTIKKQDGAYILLLDETPMQLEQGIFLAHPSLAVMHAVQQEWESQAQHVTIADMPVTRLVVALQQVTEEDFHPMQQEIMRYAASEMLAMRATDNPALYAEQEAHYTPLLQWAQRLFGVSWVISDALVPPPQPEAVMNAAHAWLESLSIPHLLLCMILTQTLTSFVLASAVFQQHCTPEKALQAAWLEHDLQMQRWGEDAELLAQRARDMAQLHAVILCANAA